MKKIFLLFILTSLVSFANPEPEPSLNPPSEEIPKTEFTYLDGIILGVVEGITEFLPVSSTGHLILTNEYLFQDRIQHAEDPEEFRAALHAFEIVIQIGAILAVVIVYFDRIKLLFRGVFQNDLEGRSLLINLIISFIPAAVIGLLLDDLIETYLFGIYPVAFALVAGAILMLWADRKKKKSSTSITNISKKQALQVGLWQCVALFPGTSRSMVTIVGGMRAGLPAHEAAEYSFLLGFITLSAASCYKMLSSGSIIMEHLPIGPLAISIIIATVTAALSVKWLVGFLTKYGLGIFAYYRIALAIAVVLLLGN